MQTIRKRKNKKIKFDEDQYIETYYYHHDKVVIPLELKNYSDLFMEHDYKQMELAYSVSDYIEEIAYMVPVNLDIEIEVHCPKLTAKQKERVKQTIKNNYGMEIDETEYDIMLQNRRSIILFIVGVITLIGYLLADKYFNSNVISELLCIFWWVAIWNVIEIQTMDKKENKDKRLNYQQLYEAKITFVVEKDDENESNR